MAIVTRTRQYLTLSGVTIALVAVAVSALGAWPLLLGGVPDGVNITAALALGCIAAAVPFSVGQRSLQGLRRMKTVAAVGIAQPIVQLVGVVSLYFVDAESYWYPVVPAAGYLINSVLVFAAARRELRFSWRIHFSRVSAEDLRGYKVSASATPFLAASILVAATFQTPRILLSNFGEPADVAEFSFVWQYYSPLYSIVTLGAQNLWPTYRDLLSNRAMAPRRLLRDVALFGVIGAGCVMALVVTTIAVQRLVVPVSLLNGWTLGAACLLMFVMALHQPSAMLLNDPEGLRRQAFLLAVMAATSIGGTVWLAPSMGSTAPFVAIGATAVALVVIPALLMAFSRARASVVAAGRSSTEVALS